jgi:hypothetical protein
LVFLVSNIPDPVNNPVTWELLPPEDNLGDVITDVFIGRPASDGWRQIADFGDDHPGISAITTHLS